MRPCGSSGLGETSQPEASAYWEAMASEDSRPRLEIDWLKTLAGALAAVSSAVLLSTLGAAGTIIGAALGSVVVTVGSALYNQGLRSSRQRLTQAQIAAARRAGTTQSRTTQARTTQARTIQARTTQSPTAGEEPVLAETTSREAGGWRQRLALLPWKHIAVLAAGLFVATLVAITAFELVAGRSVASFTGGGGGSGGTTLTHLGGGGSRPTPDRHSTPSPTTTGGASPGAPTTGATSSEGATPGATPSGGTSTGATPFGTTGPSGTTSPSAPVTSPTATPPAAPGVTP